MNLIAGCADSTGASGTIDASFAISGAVLPLVCPAPRQDAGAETLLGLRPEHIVLADSADWRGEVSVVEPTGADTYVVVTTQAGNVTVRTAPQTTLKPGDHVGLQVMAERASWFDEKSGIRLG